MTPGEEAAKQEGVDEERKRHFLGTTKTGALKATWSLVVIGFFFVVALGLNIAYTNHVQHQDARRNREAIAKSEQVWCGVLLKILAPDAGPPATERAWEVYVGLADLMRRYGCQSVPSVPPKPKPPVRSAAASPSSSATRRT